MRKLIRKIALLAAAALAVPAAAHAQPSATSVVWTLNDFTFADGATATGSFTWNPNSQQIELWDITMSSVFVGGTWNEASPSRYSNEVGNNTAGTNSTTAWVRFGGKGSQNGNYSFSFYLSDFSALDVTGSRLDLKSDSQTGYFVECENGCTNLRYPSVTRPYLSSVSTVPDVTPVPEPETYALMLAGLALLGGAAHRRRARA